jgi:hypothetical protein
MFCGSPGFINSLKKYIINVAPIKQLITETIPARRTTLLQCQRKANLDGLHVPPCTDANFWDRLSQY